MSTFILDEQTEILLNIQIFKIHWENKIVVINATVTSQSFYENNSAKNFGLKLSAVGIPKWYILWYCGAENLYNI